MKFISRLLLMILAMLLGTTAVLSLAEVSATVFPIYDNMLYKGKPDTGQYGLIPSNILYENKFWPNRQTMGTLPDREIFQALVRAACVNPGPLVIDVESISLRTSPDAARHNAETLAKLADWAHQAAPGKIIGYYGTNTLTDVPQPNFSAARGLAQHIDAFFPPLYTFDDDRSRWEKRAQVSREQARELDPNKPVYFYLWPQYHVGSVRALRYVNGDYWKFQLETARRYGDGIVIWGSSKYVWDERSGWWNATREFAASMQTNK